MKMPRVIQPLQERRGHTAVMSSRTTSRPLLLLLLLLTPMPAVNQ